MTGKLCKLCCKVVVTMYCNVLESSNNLSFVFNEKHDQASIHNPASLILGSKYFAGGGTPILDLTEMLVVTFRGLNCGSSNF